MCAGYGEADATETLLSVGQHDTSMDAGCACFSAQRHPGHARWSPSRPAWPNAMTSAGAPRAMLRICLSTSPAARTSKADHVPSRKTGADETSPSVCCRAYLDESRRGSLFSPIRNLTGRKSSARLRLWRRRVQWNSFFRLRIPMPGS